MQFVSDLMGPGWKEGVLAAPAAEPLLGAVRYRMVFGERPIGRVEVALIEKAHRIPGPHNLFGLRPSTCACRTCRSVDGGDAGQRRQAFNASLWGDPAEWCEPSGLASLLGDGGDADHGGDEDEDDRDGGVAVGLGDLVGGDERGEPESDEQGRHSGEGTADASHG